MKNTMPTTILLFCCLLFLPLLAAGADDSITPEQAAAHVGEQQTVCGAVANTYYSCFVTDRPTFINFGKPYPDHVFSVAIMGKDRDKFESCPEKLFVGRSVCVTGLIETYDGKPIMVVKDQSQVRWTD